MTQKQLKQTPVDKLLQTIDPNKIADESLRQTVEILLNLIEELKSEVKDLRSENQRLRDENNRLKGEQGQPEIKRKQPRVEACFTFLRKNEKPQKIMRKVRKTKALK